MTNDSSSSGRSLSRRLSIKKDPSEEIVLTSGDEEELEDETVLASDGQGQTLTLLEEYSMKRGNSNKPAFIVGLVCSAASLTFAYLNFLTLQ